MECYESGLPRGDVADVERWWRQDALPRYRQGHREFGNAHEHHAAGWWLEQAIQEVHDCTFYLRQVQLRLAPQEGRLRVYIAGPYKADTFEDQMRNIAMARQTMIEVYRRGHTPLCVHTMCAWLDLDAADIPRETFLATDLDWLRLCHAILLLPGWEHSPGSVAELAEAERLGLEVFHGLEDLPPPEACRD